MGDLSGFSCLPTLIRYLYNLDRTYHGGNVHSRLCLLHRKKYSLFSRRARTTIIKFDALLGVQIDGPRLAYDIQNQVISCLEQSKGSHTPRELQERANYQLIGSRGVIYIGWLSDRS